MPSIFTFGFKKNNGPNANNNSGPTSDKSGEEQMQSNNSATVPATLPNMATAIMKQANADLTIWGMPLQIAARRSDPRGLVPLPISKAISFVEAHGLDVRIALLGNIAQHPHNYLQYIPLTYIPAINMTTHKYYFFGIQSALKIRNNVVRSSLAQVSSFHFQMH